MPRRKQTHPLRSDAPDKGMPDDGALDLSAKKPRLVSPDRSSSTTSSSTITTTPPAIPSPITTSPTTHTTPTNKTPPTFKTVPSPAVSLGSDASPGLIGSPWLGSLPFFPFPSLLGGFPFLPFSSANIPTTSLASLSSMAGLPFRPFPTLANTTRPSTTPDVLKAKPPKPKSDSKTPTPKEHKKPLPPPTKEIKVIKEKKETKGNPLDVLSSLVHKVGERKGGGPGEALLASAADAPGSSLYPHFPLTDSPNISMQELYWKYMKKEESMEAKRVSEAKAIFTCLQCQASFQSMEQLVKHMQATQHFTNLPKNYTWSLQYTRQKMRQMRLKLKYSEKMEYLCTLCGSTFPAPIQQHFTDFHDMHNPVENMKFVQIVRMKGKDGSSSPTPSTNSSSSNHSPPNSPRTNGIQSPRNGSSSLLSKMEQCVAGLGGKSEGVEIPLPSYTGPKLKKPPIASP